MVYTVTFNPSLDHIVEVDDFRTGITNRVTAEEMRPGGKGINVSIVLKELGAENVIVSMAGEGAVFIDSDGNVTMLDAPQGKLVNAVGAGDSMVAGFIAGIIKTGNPKEAFKLGVAAGSATAFSEWLADGNSIASLHNTM